MLHVDTGIVIDTRVLLVTLSRKGDILVLVRVRVNNNRPIHI